MAARKRQQKKQQCFSDGCDGVCMRVNTHTYRCSSCDALFFSGICISSSGIIYAMRVNAQGKPYVRIPINMRAQPQGSMPWM